MITQFDPLNLNRFASAIGVELGNTDYNYYVGEFTYGGASNTMNQYYPLLFGATSIATLSQMVAVNLGLTGDVLIGGKTYIQNQLQNASWGARGSTLMDIINLFCGLTTDSTFGPFATNFNLHVSSTVAYSQIKFLPTVTFNVNGILTTPVTPTFNIKPVASSITAGNTVSFNIQTANFPVGYQTDYKITSAPSIQNGAPTFFDGIIYPVTIKPVDANGVENISFLVSPNISSSETITLSVGDAKATVAVIGNQLHV